MAELETVFVGLGSNLGNGVTTLRQAARALGEISEGSIAQSSLWLTEPLDMTEESGWFTNAVVSFSTGISPQQLLRELQALEVNAGRPLSHGRNTDRTLDLDIIDYGGRSVRSPSLTLPHPRAHERPFVLLPLLEIDADFRFCHLDLTAEKALEQVQSLQMRRLSESWEP